MTTRPWHLNRRELLRGGGVALALPLLQAMGADKPSSATPARPKRLLVSYFAYGAYMPNAESGVPSASNKPYDEWSWWPCKDAGPLTFNKSAEPFADLKGQVSYLRGLDHAGGWTMGGHSSGDVFATGADMTDKQKQNAISIDQVAANAHGHLTRHPSLVLGTEGGTGSYGMTKTLSHRGPGRPIPALHKPKDIFSRLFTPYEGESVEAVRARLKREASVLDLLAENTRDLSARLGREDKATVDEYLESVRAIEKRVERANKWTEVPLPKVDAKAVNLDAPQTDPKEYIRCLYDLVFLAYQTDSTRFATLMLESEHSQDSPTWNYATYALGYKGATHDLAHKRPVESGHWDRWRAEQHAYFLKRLHDTREGDGTLLDRTLVLWGSAHPHASHSGKNYPLQLAGGGALGFKHGKLHAFEGKKKVPLANLFVTMLNALDVPTEKFADSTGAMTDLSA
jgi:hypothetical protein